MPCTVSKRRALISTMRSREFESYLAVNFALLLEKDVRLSGERKNVSYDRDGRWTGRKPRGSPLLDDLANQQEGEESDSQAAQNEQRLGAGHRHQRRRFQRHHLCKILYCQLKKSEPTSVSPPRN
ncbi:hypothetical protein CRENBAI_018200 [Crenichthys baileyi]|uniref:Uncharacterized protein n=1 Tax=Crenichthys baileyi TaxID=28760 RepID=A0AAV9SPG7_9TELE